MQENTKPYQNHTFHLLHLATVDRENERRTLIVVILTLVTMVVEIVTGILTGSMALLSDGWHMGTHAGALGIAFFAYVYSRKYAAAHRYTFGVGKIGILAAFVNAIVLGVTGLLIFYEAALRFISPVMINFNTAILVAIIGLLVNFICAWILKPHGGHHHDHHEIDSHDHHYHEHHHGKHGEDYNYRAAFLHVVADAMTSVFAIAALLIGKYYGWVRLDPVAGFLGGAMILWWAYGLMRQTSRILLDGDISLKKMQEMKEILEEGSTNEILDLHAWHISENDLAIIVAILTDHPQPPEHYHALLNPFDNLKHVTVEIHRRDECAAKEAAC